MENALKRYYRHPGKYKTIPGLSISNRELKERVKNRSIIINQGGKQYSEMVQIDRTMKKSPVEHNRDWLSQEKGIEELYTSLEKNKKKPTPKPSKPEEDAKP